MVRAVVLSKMEYVKLEILVTGMYCKFVEKKRFCSHSLRKNQNQLSPCCKRARLGEYQCSMAGRIAVQTFATMKKSREVGR